MKDRDKFDELLHSKLYDFEAETTPGDWEAIADRLPRKAPVPLYRSLRYWAAAAVVALLMVTGGIYLYDNETTDSPLVQQVEQETQSLERQLLEEAGIPDVTASAKEETTDPNTTSKTTIRQALTANVFTPGKEETEANKDMNELRVTDDANAVMLIREGDESGETQTVEAKEAQEKADDEPQPFIPGENVRQPITKQTQEQKEKPIRRWGFGAGAGSVSMSANNTVPQIVTNSNGLRADNLYALNNMGAINLDERDLPKTNIKHKTPVTFGLGVSYMLNDRWSIGSGVNYTYLSSSWETNGKSHAKTEQNLHFVGIPLSLVYKIAEWQNISFYGSAGVMTEINVAGNKKTRLFANDSQTDNTVNIPIEKENIRMKEWMWSLNARAGASYPLISFLNIFAEAGANYYFDNHSEIETVRSEKPFNVSFQLGLRLGF